MAIMAVFALALFCGPATAAPPVLAKELAQRATPPLKPLPPDVQAAYKELFALRAKTAFVKELPAAVAEACKQLDADERRVTIRQANLFHRHLIDVLIDESIFASVRPPYPPPLQVRYHGSLATEGVYDIDGIIEKLTLEGSIGGPLSWSIGAGGLGIFDVDLTTAKTKFSLAKCSIEGQEFYANVMSVVDLHSVDDKLPQLGGKSVREVLAKIEQPLAKAYSRDATKEEKPPGK